MSAARLGTIAASALLLAGLAWLIHGKSAESVLTESGRALASSSGPPWILGQPRARYTFIAYADLECPYCRQYLPVLRQFIAEHPEANLQWRHLPLAEHEPAAIQAARFAECAGEAGGGPAFWAAVDWLYAHPSANALSDPNSARSPQMTSRVETCIRSSRPDAVISRDVTEASRDRVSATPTLHVLDRESGRSLMLEGIVEPDALLSAMDLLASPASESEPQ